VVERGTTPLTAAHFSELLSANNAFVLDTRSPEIFTSGFVPGAINIGLDGRFAEWAGSLVPFDRPVLLITDAGAEKESVIRLARVGFERILGCLEGGYAAWKEAGGEIDMIVNVEADELMMDIPFDPNIVILDVRKPAEFAAGHLKKALTLPLNKLTDTSLLGDLNDTDNIYIHCASGYRSVIAASILKKEGYHNLRNVSGGWDEISKEKKADIVDEKSVLN
jgi:hydroxyacylglutathione hydrolase